MKFPKYILIVLVSLFFPLYLLGQDYLKGQVLDENTQEPLAFATVRYSPRAGVITNENGFFTIPNDVASDSLVISYIGYTTQRIAIVRDSALIKVEMRQEAMSMPEVVVTAKDLYASGLLYRGSKKSRKATAKRKSSKVFRRTYSYRDKAPSEHMEAFYNAMTRAGGVDQFELKNGRYGVPSESSFLNIQITDVLQSYNLYTNNYNDLPGSPLQYTSLKKLRKDFDVRLRNRYVVEQDTIVELFFEPLRKKDILFSGQAWVRLSNLMIEKVELTIDNTARNPFVIIPNPELNTPLKFDLDFSIGFKYEEEDLVLDFINMTYDMKVLTPQQLIDVQAKSNFYFYDYDDPFMVPFFPAYALNYHDYERILFFPYDPVFWERNYLIAETEEELNFRKKLESLSLFRNQNGNEAALIRRRYESWTPNWSIIPQLVQNRELWEGQELDQVLYVNRIGVPEEYTLFAKTFIFLNAECYQGSAFFNTDAMIDYRFSFSIDQNIRDFVLLEKALLLTKIHANQLQAELQSNFPSGAPCPKREDLNQYLKAANKKLDKEIKLFLEIIHNYPQEKLDAYLKALDDRFKESTQLIKS